jgi:hypothetical protein
VASDNVRNAIAERDSDREPPRRNMPALRPLPPDDAEILRIIGLDPDNPVAHAVVRVAEHYGLDPLLGHIDILPNTRKPYITRDGYLHIAHGSGQFDGMDVQGPKRDERDHQWRARVSIFRKDMTHPFTFEGRCAQEGRHRDNAEEMAVARAERRALKRAFDVTVPQSFAADADDDDTLPPTPLGRQLAPAAPPAPDDPDDLLTDSQRTGIMAGFRELGIGTKDRHRLLGVWCERPITSVKQLTGSEAVKTLDMLADLRRAKDAEQMRASDAAAHPADAGPRLPLTDAQRNEVIDALESVGVTEAARACLLLSQFTGREITTTADVERGELSAIYEAIDAMRETGGEHDRDA